MMPKDRSENFSFHQVRFMYTTNRTWRKIAVAALVALCLLIIAVIIILLWYFVFRIPDQPVQRDSNEPTPAPSPETTTPWNGCFPPEATVVTPSGPKRMDQLELGSKILDLNSDGQCCQWTIVYAFSFFDDHKRALTKIDIDNRTSIRLTPNHLLFRRDHKSMIKSDLQASDIRVDDLIYLKQSIGRVSRVQSILGKGAYSPFTYSGTMLVDNVWVSCFAGRYFDGRIGHGFIQKYATAPLRALAASIDFWGNQQLSEYVLTPDMYHLWYVRFLKFVHSIAL